MTRHDRYLFRLWLARWGFALMVAAAILVGLAAAMTVAPPLEVPTVALRAPVVYRAEVGAAVFFALYVAMIAFALALHNRGFTEIGSSGLKAQDLATVSEGAIANYDFSLELIASLQDEMESLRFQRQEDRGVH
jgi:hypothetical protein